MASCGGVRDDGSHPLVDEESAHASAVTLKTTGSPGATSREMVAGHCRNRGADDSHGGGVPSGSNGHTSQDHDKQRRGDHELGSDGNDAASTALEAHDATQDGLPAGHGSSAEPPVLKRHDVASKCLLAEQRSAPHICRGGKERASMACLQTSSTVEDGGPLGGVAETAAHHHGRGEQGC